MSAPVLSQSPAELDIAWIAGDDLGALLDFDIDLTGYVVTADVQADGNSAVQAITVTVVNAATGQINIALTDAQTAALGACKRRWVLRWVAPGSVQRTVLAGNFTLRLP